MPLEIDKYFLNNSYSKIEYLRLIEQNNIAELKNRILIDIAIAYKHFVILAENKDDNEFRFTHGFSSKELLHWLEKNGINESNIDNFLKTTIKKHND